MWVRHGEGRGGAGRADSGGGRVRSQDGIALPAVGPGCYAPVPSPVELSLPSSGNQREPAATVVGIPWDSVAPLFADGWRGRQAAWDVLACWLHVCCSRWGWLEMRMLQLAGYVC